MSARADDLPPVPVGAQPGHDREPAVELRCAALAALQLGDVDARCAAVDALCVSAGPLDIDARLTAPAEVPARPPRPPLVAPHRLARRAIGTGDGRAALLHALAHIEFNAIGLALDHLWRFAGLPAEYYQDWARVAMEERRHFTLLRERLRESGHDYGDFPAHDGLWEMARRTTDDVLDRMAIVPRTLEARGLDASPAVRAKFDAIGDHESARLIDVILHDEIGHVGIGNRWFHYLCAQRGVDPVAAQRRAAARCGAPRQRGPFNLEARRRAGFTVLDLDELQRSAE